MKFNQFIRFCLVICTLISTSAWAQSPSETGKHAPEKVRLQLKWFNQFQFAGYYAAIEQGYYAEEGLNVEIKERELEKNFVKQVTSGEAEYGIGDSGLLSQYAQGEKIAALAAIFQHNPLVFMAKQTSGIISPYEMIGKRVMSDIISTNEAPLRAMLAGTGISEKDYQLIPQRNDYALLTQDKVDVISGYLTDQPYYYKQQGVKVNIINPQNYGVDFYGDILFTSQSELQDHPGRAERFRKASLKGWRYALDHPEAMIQIISKKYHSKLSIEHLRFEAAETRKLILPDVIPLGQIERSRMKMVANIYANSGFNRPLNDTEIAAFIYTGTSSELKLNDQEKRWLATHPVIKVGIDRDFAPYEWIDQDGNYIGMAADYMRLLERKLGVRFEIIKNKSWSEILTMAKRGELDMLSFAVKTDDRSQYLIFSDPFKATPAVIIDNNQGEFIGSLKHLSGKSVAIERGYFMQELLQKQHPQIKLVLATNTHDALNMVIDGKADAYVGDAGSVNYTIKKDGLLSLRFSGQTEYLSQHSIAVTKANPELAAIVSKAMASIPKAETDAIFNRWLGLKIEQGIKAESLIKYAVALLLLLMLFSYWAYRMQREISIRKAAELREQTRSHIMEMLTSELTLTKVLEEIVKSVEKINPAMLCSIVLLDSEGKRLTNGAAPSLPDFYNNAINGVEIGLGVGSCGTAAFTGKRVIVEDIATHPYWSAYKELAARAGLGACWSQPILTSSGKVLGTFAIYHHRPHTPSAADIAIIEQSANLASIAIERKQAATSLAESHLLLETVIEAAPIRIFWKDKNLRYQGCNSVFAKDAGLSSPEELIGKDDFQMTWAEQAELYRADDRAVIESGVSKLFYDEPQTTPDGRTIWLRTSKVPLKNQNNESLGILGTYEDITEHKQTETELKIAATAFESQEGMLVTDANSVILRVNNAFTRITGYSAEEAVGQTSDLLNSGRQDKAFYVAMWASIHNTGAWSGEIWNRRKSGEIYPEQLTITAVKNNLGVVTNYVATLTDITMSKAASDEIKNLAFYDPLTHLPNRRLLMDRLKQALAASTRSSQRGALLFLDLDHFKTLNDTSGHDIGDLLLQQVAKRLIACVREGDTVARLGGDEFVVLLEDLSTQEIEAANQTEAISDKILATLNQPYQLGANKHHSTPSIGATLFYDHDAEIDTLLKQADIAMYQAKQAGRNTLRFFDPQMQANISARADLEHELRKAIELQQFQLHYQIQVTNNCQPLGAEALIRWQHPERGMISPFHFIPLAEDTGLILPIGQWVLETACAQLKLWQNDTLTKELTLSVNVSAKQFQQANFVTQMQDTVQRHGIDPSKLKLELTESMLVDNVETIISNMHTLAATGIRFSLDDFGTGYSSLQYLKKLPLHQLKIDQSFVRDIETDSSDRAIVRTIIAMAHSLDLSVIAEGVETEAQRQRLSNKDCINFQGYLFGKPMPIEEFETSLRNSYHP